METYCNSYFKVDTDTVVENYRKVQNYIGPDTGIIPVVKGNCYGYGIIAMAKLYKERCGAEIIACSAMQEAVDLRNEGLEGELLVIGGIPQHLLEGAVKYDLQIPLFEETTARRLQEIHEPSKPIKVHIKIETGMNRLGIRPGKDLEKLLELVKTLDGREPIGLIEPLEIGAYITNIHHIEAGESIGYSQAFIADRPMDIATISVGFGDGFYPKWMRGFGPVLINGQRTNFLGCCMDQSFADVTGLDCKLGDKAILIGKSGDERITTWDMEQFCGNTFEFLYGTIGHRVERIYV